MSDSNKPMLAIQAGEKNGQLTGQGSVSLSGDQGSVLAAFQRQGDGKTQVTLNVQKDVAIAADETLAFGGHADLDPRTGKISAGTQMTFTVANSVAADLQAQFGPGAPSASLDLKISL